MSKKDKLHIGVIFGGRSGEHEISLMSARSVLSAIDIEKYIVTQIGVTHNGVWMIGENVLEAMIQQNYRSLSPTTIFPDPSRQGLFRINDSEHGELLELLTRLDVVFPLLHGTFGEDGTIQGLLELADIAYVGAGVLGSSVGMDKGVFKDVMRANSIPVLESVIVLRSEIASDVDTALSRAEQVAQYPLFVNLKFFSL